MQSVMEPSQISAASLRKMLHFIATDLGLNDPAESVNPVTLTRQIREEIGILLRQGESECRCYCVGDQADASDCPLHGGNR